MSKTYKYGFVLAKTSGFTPDWGIVKSSFEDSYTLQAQHALKPGEVIFYVDANAFTFEQAKEIAEKKAQELFGGEPSWLDNVLDDMMTQARGLPHLSTEEEK